MPQCTSLIFYLFILYTFSVLPAQVSFIFICVPIACSFLQKITYTWTFAHSHSQLPKMLELNLLRPLFLISPAISPKWSNWTFWGNFCTYLRPVYKNDRTESWEVAFTHIRGQPTEMSNWAFWVHFCLYPTLAHPWTSYYGSYKFCEHPTRHPIDRRINYFRVLA